MSSYFKEGEQAYNSNISEKPLSEQNIFKRIITYYNIICDKIIIYILERWLIALILLIIYLIRMFTTNGFYALTYCMGIHFLNSFIGFISPLEDPEEEGVNVDDISYLPQNSKEEFRPFYRKVKEFQFWSVIFWTLLIGNIMTFFEIFDIPVFWPLLLVYFILIFILTMRNQIKHMMKYHYLPWDAGKINYNPK